LTEYLLHYRFVFMLDFKQVVSEETDRIIATRRDLHRIPEIAFTEWKTSAYITDYLKKEGFEVTTGIAKTGVVGLLRTGKPGPTLLIRADMDALPVTEETGLPFASEHEGRMHACGHDAHITMVLSAATAINKFKEQLTGNLKFLFQPAEESPGGAKPMIEEGVMEHPHVDYAVGCHVWPLLPQGQIGVKAGPIMAAADQFDIKILGKGGHGAMPHLCVDALEIGTQVVNALQRIVSRHTNPLESAVLSVCRFQSGTAFNVIPGEAILSGTTRTFNKAIWESWEERIHRILRGICESMGADYEFTFTPYYPPTINHPEIAQLVGRCAAEAVGAENVVEPEPSMGAEDMAFYLERCKGCFFFLGVGREESYPIHHPKFDFDENVLLTGAEIYCRVAFDLLGK
jgi:amidohydrolase